MLGWRGKEARGRAPQPQPRPPAGSLWTRVASWLAPGQQQPGPADAATEARLSAEDDPDAVHIFTIASGHMYERLQKIMILSVLRNTRRAPARVYPPCPNPNPLACPSRLLAALPPSLPASHSFERLQKVMILLVLPKRSVRPRAAPRCPLAAPAPGPCSTGLMQGGAERVIGGRVRRQAHLVPGRPATCLTAGWRL